MQILAKKINGDQVEIQKILWTSFELGFTNKKGKLESIQYPGFYLSEQKSLAQLYGIKSLAILENSEGEKKYLLPPYRFPGYSLAPNNIDTNRVMSKECCFDKGAIFKDHKA